MVKFSLLFLTFFLTACGMNTQQFIPSCNVYQDSIKCWKGKNIMALKKEWGIPNRVDALPEDEKILTYVRPTYRAFNTSTHSPIYNTVVSANTGELVSRNNNDFSAHNFDSNLQCTTQFTLNDKDIIVGVHSNGVCIDA